MKLPYFVGLHKLNNPNIEVTLDPDAPPKLPAGQTTDLKVNIKILKNDIKTLDEKILIKSKAFTECFQFNVLGNMKVVESGLCYQNEKLNHLKLHTVDFNTVSIHFLGPHA